MGACFLFLVLLVVVCLCVGFLFDCVLIALRAFVGRWGVKLCLNAMVCA